MKITLLGTGTPAPSLTRQSSGYLIDVAGDVLVWDHGPGAHHRLLEGGRRATEVTHAFFTHLHYDHCLDYARLVLQRWDQGAGRIPDLPVYGPPPLAHMTRRLFDEDGVYGVDILARTGHESSIDVFHERGGTGVRQPPRPQVTEIHAGSVIRGKSWTLTAGHAQHVQPYLECLAFRLDADEGSICYSGDSGLCEPLIELARGCDVLVMMNHHYSGTEASPAFRAACGNHEDNAVLAERAGVKKLVLTHITSALDRPGVHDDIKKQMQKVFAGEVIWGEDLMEIEVRAEGKGHRAQVR